MAASSCRFSLVLQKALNRKVLWIHNTCSGFFEFIFGALRGMDPFGSVAAGHGWCSTRLSYQPSLPCCTQERELYESCYRTCFPSVNRLHVHVEFSALMGHSALYLYLCVSITWCSVGPNGNGTVEQQSFLSYQMVAGCICREMP